MIIDLISESNLKVWSGLQTAKPSVYWWSACRPHCLRVVSDPEDSMPKRSVSFAEGNIYAIPCIQSLREIFTRAYRLGIAPTFKTALWHIPPYG